MPDRHTTDARSCPCPPPPSLSPLGDLVPLPLLSSCSCSNRAERAPVQLPAPPTSPVAPPSIPRAQGLLSSSPTSTAHQLARPSFSPAESAPSLASRHGAAGSSCSPSTPPLWSSSARIEAVVSSAVSPSSSLAPSPTYIGRPLAGTSSPSQLELLLRHRPPTDHLRPRFLQQTGPRGALMLSHHSTAAGMAFPCQKLSS